MERKKHKQMLQNIAIDLILTAAALIIFALFHHVLPRPQESVGIVINNPYKTELPADDSSLIALPEDTVYAASLAPLSGKSNHNRNTFSSNGKGGSALTDSEAEETETEEDVPLSQKFSEHYTDEAVTTDSSYSSPDISITVTQETALNGNVTYYLADIYVRDVTCFQTALAKDTYGSGFRDSIADMAELSEALIAINGDYYGNTREGVVIRNGVIYRANPTDCDVCVLYYDGTMRVMPGSAFDMDEAIEDGAWQAWTFGPALLDQNGDTITAFSSTSRIISSNPRTAIGYYEPGHYCMVVVDGRGESDGISLPDLSELFYDLGCKAAYNLDGGNSSIMVWENQIINQPSGGGRESSDAILIKEVNSYD